MTPIEEKTYKMFDRISQTFLNNKSNRERIEDGFKNWLAMQDAKGDFRGCDGYWIFNKFVVQYTASDASDGCMLFCYFDHLKDQEKVIPNEAYDRAMRGI